MPKLRIFRTKVSLFLLESAQGLIIAFLSIAELGLGREFVSIRGIVSPFMSRLEEVIVDLLPLMGILGRECSQVDAGLSSLASQSLSPSSVQDFQCFLRQIALEAELGIPPVEMLERFLERSDLGGIAHLKRERF